MRTTFFQIFAWELEEHGANKYRKLALELQPGDSLELRVSLEDIQGIIFPKFEILCSNGRWFAVNFDEDLADRILCTFDSGTVFSTVVVSVNASEIKGPHKEFGYYSQSIYIEVELPFEEHDLERERKG